MGNTNLFQNQYFIFICFTDESPTTCTAFLEDGGLILFLSVLETFPGEASVETKILGLINNIAEVPQLRVVLLEYQFIKVLRFVSKYLN